MGAEELQLGLFELNDTSPPAAREIQVRPGWSGERQGNTSMAYADLGGVPEETADNPSDLTADAILARQAHQREQARDVQLVLEFELPSLAQIKAGQIRKAMGWSSTT